MTITTTPSDQVRLAADTVLGSTADWQLLSSEHSAVWTVCSQSQRWSVKHLVDRSSDADIEHRVMSRLSTRHVRRIHRIVDLDDGSQVVISPFIAGEPLADRLVRGELSETESATVASGLQQVLHEIAALELPEDGFGRLGGGRRPVHQRWPDALRDYLEEQRRKGPQVSALLYQRLSDTLTELDSRFEAEVPVPTLHPSDVNARNFLLREGGSGLVVVNLPVIWQGDPARPYGALQLHLDQSPVAAAVLAGEPWPTWRIHFYAMYHAFVILVYAERFSPVPLPDVTPWGRVRPLLDLFDIHDRQLREVL